MSELLGIKKVRPIDDWGWWYAVGEIYEVKPYQYKATRGATTDYCHCSECEKERSGKELYEMYEVASGPKAGSIIPVMVCIDA